ncbi:hypothetical protein L245_26935, partial [Salmonella enterica subsp. enterica serovar Worthington str. BCH-4719]
SQRPASSAADSHPPFAGPGVTELRRLRQLEDENQRLKKLVAELSLDKEMLQEVLKQTF